MNVSDVVFEMELGGVDTADIASIVDLCQSRGFNSDFIDQELLKRGYPKIFTVDYYEDDEYYSIEKFPYKHQYRD